MINFNLFDYHVLGKNWVLTHEWLTLSSFWRRPIGWLIILKMCHRNCWNRFVKTGDVHVSRQKIMLVLLCQLLVGTIAYASTIKIATLKYPPYQFKADRYIGLTSRYRYIKLLKLLLNQVVCFHLTTITGYELKIGRTGSDEILSISVPIWFLPADSRFPIVK